MAKIKYDRLDELDCQDICNLYKSGWSMYALGNEFNVPLSSIQKVLRENKVKLRRKKNKRSRAKT